MNYNNEGSGDLDAVTSAGAATPRDPVTQLITFTAGTYYVELGSDTGPATAAAALSATHLAWSAAFAATITVESCNFPAGTLRKGTGRSDISSFDATAGNWIAEASATNTPVVGASNTSAGLTVTAGGAAAGGCIYHLGNDGARRKRLKLVVGTGGTCRINRHVKLAS